MGFARGPARTASPSTSLCTRTRGQPALRRDLREQAAGRPGPAARRGTARAWPYRRPSRCRCDYCRGAYATYRARRRAEDNPTHPRSLDTDGHLPGHYPGTGSATASGGQRLPRPT